MKSTIKQFLKSSINLVKKCNTKKIGDYSSIYEFVYKNGQSFRPMPLPKSIRRGGMKACYKNALMLAFEKLGYSYAEGYARGVIPTLHAWCVDKKGNVVDPTWSDGKEYFGVVFKKSYIFKQLNRNRGGGFIDNWQDEWPLLRTDKKDWEKDYNIKNIGGKNG